MRTCLIINSDRGGAELFQKAVDASDLVVGLKYVASCRDAIKYVLNKQTVAPDFVFFEWYLPGIDGMDCLLTLRQYTKLSGCKFVIYGGDDPAEMYDLSMLHDCLLFPKSDSIPEMSRILNKILGLKKAREL